MRPLAYRISMSVNGWWMWYERPRSRSFASNWMRSQAGAVAAMSELEGHAVLAGLDAVLLQQRAFGRVFVEDRVGVVDVDEQPPSMTIRTPATS